jgi:2'-5' RNA ligase
MPAQEAGTQPRRGADKLRLFVALDLPVEVRRDLNAWRRQAFTDPALRLIEGPRMRLLFLGHRPQRQVVPYLEAIRALCAQAPAPLIELGDLEARGRRSSRPRLFTLAAHSPGTEALQRGLRSIFEKRGLVFHESRQRAFRTHLTVARVQTEGRPSRRPLPVSSPPEGRLPASLRRPFRAQSIGLYSSQLRPEGARHRLLGEAELIGGR